MLTGCVRGNRSGESGESPSRRHPRTCPFLNPHRHPRRLLRLHRHPLRHRRSRPAAARAAFVTRLVDLNDNHRVGITHWPDRDPSTGAHGETVGSLECFPGDPPETYHVHSHLSIFLDDVALAIPEDIGIVKLHAHDQVHSTRSTRTITPESSTSKPPLPRIFTLGDFFMIWGQPLRPDNVAGLTGKPIVVYVTDNNGVVTQATGDWNDIELLSHREITIQVGTPITEIPNFTWTAH